MKPIELQEMVIGSCGGKGLGVSGIEIIVQAAFAYEDHPAQFINLG